MLIQQTCSQVCHLFTTALLIIIGLVASSHAAFAQVANLSYEEQISFDMPAALHSIQVAGDTITHWQSGQYEVLHVAGNARIGQGEFSAHSDQAIVWVEIPGADAEHKVIVYLERDVEVSIDGSAGANRIADQQWLGRLRTSGTVDLARNSVDLIGEPPAIFNRAKSALSAGTKNEVGSVAFLQDFNAGGIDAGGINANSMNAGGPTFTQNQVWTQDGFGAEDGFGSADGASVQAARPQMVVNPQTGQLQSVLPPAVQNSPQFQPGGLLPGRGQASPSPSQPFSIEISGRDPTINLNFKNFVNPDNPNERVSIGVGGVRLAIDSPVISTTSQFQGDSDPKLYVSANNVVHWQQTLPDGSRRNQFYLEGDVVFAKDSRVIYAERMFYDVESQQGTILKAEVLTNVDSFRGAVRLKADVVQQLNQNTMQAYGAAFTTSRMGVPRYWLQSESIGLQQVAGQSGDSLVFDPAGGVAANNLLGSLNGNSETDYVVDGRQNRVYLGGVPVFAWPRIRTNLNDPTLYLKSFNVGSDNIFGSQIRTGWDLNQILGFDHHPNSEWIGNLDYLSERGLAFGSQYTYDRQGLLGIPGHVQGRYESWFINDDGQDFLGRDRRSLTPEEDFRGRSILRHRHDFAPGYQLRAELGYVSDRNFLEQFYEREWDTSKDAATGVWLERNVGTDSYNLTGDLQLNRFFTQTSGIKFDHFKLGQPILNHRAIWHSHNHAGYVRLRQASTPTDAVDAAKFDPLAWETDVDGIRAGTRQEINFPTQLGPVKVVPYLLGDATYWQEARDGNDLFRAYGQTGIRASLPMWRVDPSIKSVLWNVDGLAHKVSFDVDAYFAEASQDLGELALYDPLDDDSQEHFRRRFAFDTFGILAGGDVPLRFDERNFAYRSGMQGNVTGSSEIADDAMAVKLGVRQKWQTKRGLPGRQHIIDWITLDAQATLFPKADRDNFGSDFGMFDYDFRWYVGDRLSLVSDGYFDFFSQGLRTASFGANISRPEIGNAYVGYRMIEGPISSNILSASMTYRMSDKWGVKGGGQIDFGETGTIGQTLSLIYIGESFLWQFGFNYDHSRENFGFRFGFEPRFTKKPQLFRPGGTAIPPAGSRWLE